MDFRTREHIKQEINAAARKREGLPAGRVRTTPRQPNMNPGRRWTDGQVLDVFRACAADLGIKYNELTMARYRAWRNADKTRGPSVPALTKRIPSMSRLPRALA